MAKCHRCGKSGLFMSVNQMGLCPACQRDYFYVEREVEIFFESSKIVTNTDNLSTRLSRCDLVVQKLYKIKDFGNGRYDLLWEITKSNHIDEAMELYSRMTEILRKMYTGIEEFILNVIQENGSASKKSIVDAINTEQQNAEKKLPFDVDKSVISMLKDMEDYNKIRKEKIKNRYEYFLIDSAAG